MSKYDWSGVPSEVKYIATDERVVVYGFDCKPYVTDVFVCYYQGFQKKLNITPFDGHFSDSL